MKELIEVVFKEQTKGNPIECKNVGCTRKGFWVETSAIGEKRICFRAKHDGEFHIVKLTLSELEEEIR
jgi:hypothetical protein